jgi:hypothetical protein
MKRAADNVVAALRVGIIVSARLDNIDLSGLWPSTICFLNRHHPNSGPKPIPSRKFGSNLNSTVFDASTYLGIDATGLYRVNNGAIGNVRSYNAVGRDVRGTNAFSLEVYDVVRLDKLLILKCWLDP